MQPSLADRSMKNSAGNRLRKCRFPSAEIRLLFDERDRRGSRYCPARSADRPVGEMSMIGINGMAHVILTVSRFDLARAFYGKLLPELGMKLVSDGDRFFYCVGSRTAIGFEPGDP